MSNAPMNDKHLSAKAKGILAWAFSCADGWQFSIRGMAACFADGKDSIESGLKELKRCGYLRISKQYPDATDSHKIEYVYDFYEKPQVNQEADFQPLEFQPLENPDGKQVLNKQVPNELTPFPSTETKTVSVEGNPPAKKPFRPPTYDEVRAYAAENNLAVDAETFVDYYASKGWKVNRDPMKDWQCAARNWDRRERRGKGGTSARQQTRLPDYATDFSQYETIDEYIARREAEEEAANGNVQSA